MLSFNFSVIGGIILLSAPLLFDHIYVSEVKHPIKYKMEISSVRGERYAFVFLNFLLVSWKFWRESYRPHKCLGKYILYVDLEKLSISEKLSYHCIISIRMKHWTTFLYIAEIIQVAYVKWRHLFLYCCILSCTQHDALQSRHHIQTGCAWPNNIETLNTIFIDFSVFHS